MKNIILALLAVIAIFCVVAAMQPADFRISRSATIAAPPSAVYDQIVNLQKWNVWSPWAKLDPNAKNTLSEPAAGVGASFAWSGNSQVGEGRMTITDTKLNERVLMNLEFTKPFAATNTTEFTLKPEGNQTAITWSMTGHNNFVGKAMSLLMNCDKMIGTKYEEGFANLKKIVEKPKAGGSL
ncbi:MAG: SRPBCC family protein [Chthoniobacter sp.]|nr:SRPBCC family protein [Chthoniobacter sp.]